MAETMTLARPYARAAFEHAHASSALSAWSDVLSRLAQLVQAPNMRAFIDHPDVPPDDKIATLLDLAGESVDEAMRNFVALLAHNDRLALVPEVAEAYEELRAEAEKTIEAEVVSARELSEEQQQKLAAALKERLGREVTLRVQLDESLMGGAVIRAGDLVIDGSAQGRLRQLARALGV